jgi:diguanylate cyclase (GGDEF)-like protein
VLQTFARSLRSICRDYDYVARMGGDEFVIVLPEAGPEAAQAKAKLIHECAMQAGEQVCGERVLGASVGTAYSPSDGLDAEELLAEADKRMYIEKKAHHASKNANPLPSNIIVMGRSASVN